MLLEVENLEVTYRGGFRAVKGVSFSLDEGGALGIVGESGSGKSSLVRTLMLLEKPSGGSFRYRGEDATALSRASLRRFRREVRMIFQDATGSLDPRMKVGDALAETLATGAPEEDRTKRIGELLELTGLSRATLAQYPHELSGGQCQRASIARSLATRPRLLVADEPVSALDVSVQARILNLMRDLREGLGIAVILVSHDLAVVRNVCSRVAVMHEGRFVETGESEAIFAAPKDEYTRRLIDAVPDVARELAKRG